eukprot:3032662-Pleurochrysis_carterae.AAC.2
MLVSAKAFIVLPKGGRVCKSWRPSSAREGKRRLCAGHGRLNLACLACMQRIDERVAAALRRQQKVKRLGLQPQGKAVCCYFLRSSSNEAGDSLTIFGVSSVLEMSLAVVRWRCRGSLVVGRHGREHTPDDGDIIGCIRAPSRPQT